MSAKEESSRKTAVGLDESKTEYLLNEGENCEVDDHELFPLNRLSVSPNLLASAELQNDSSFEEIYRACMKKANSTKGPQITIISVCCSAKKVSCVKFIATGMATLAPRWLAWQVKTISAVLHVHPLPDY